MKNSILTLVFLSLAFCSNAQIELKIRPLGLLFGTYGGTIEYKLSERKSIDFEAYGVKSGFNLFGSKLNTKGFGTNVTYRSYFATSKKRSGGFWGPYALFTKSDLEGTLIKTPSTTEQVRVKVTNLGVGSLIGYKWGFNNNVTLEILFGLGVNVSHKYEDLFGNTPELFGKNINSTGRFALGYSFGNENKK